MSSNTTTPTVYTPIGAIEQLQEHLNIVTERMYKTAKTSTDTSTSNIEFLVLRAIESIEGMDGTADRILHTVVSHKQNITNELSYKLGKLVTTSTNGTARPALESIAKIKDQTITTRKELVHTMITTTVENIYKVLSLTLQAIASIERMHRNMAVTTTRTATASDVLVRTTLRTMDAIERMTNTANHRMAHEIATIHAITSESSSTTMVIALNDDPPSSRKRPRFDEDYDDDYSYLDEYN